MITNDYVTSPSNLNEYFLLVTTTSLQESFPLEVQSQVWGIFLANGSPLKKMKNAFCFTKVFFVLEIFKVLS